MPSFTFFRQLSIKHKMTLVSTAITVLALLIASLALLSYFQHYARLNVLEDATSLARLLADRSTAALTFEDRRLAEENIAAVKSKRSVVAVCITDRQGAVFAQLNLRAGGSSLCASSVEVGSHRFHENDLELVEPVLLKGERIGNLFVRASLDDLNALWQKYILFTLVIVVMTGVLAYILSARLIAIISRPLTLLTQTAQHIANRTHDESLVADQELVRKTTEDEIGTLVDAFNEMLKQIRERDLFLQETNEQLEGRVLRRTEALDASNQQLQALAGDLRQAKEMAEAANLAKSNFLARMSHELRTPLNAILGFSQLMGKDSDVSEEHREQLDIINRSGEHLLTMINDVLDLSKIEAGKVTLSKRVLDLHHLCVEVVELMRIRAKEKHLPLTLEIAELVPLTIRADEGKLRQILINLVGNAIKFTAQGVISLHVSAPRKGYVRIEVRDTGVGISEEYQASIFEPFVQAENLANAKGTGLGLAITHKFVELMGGTNGLTSTLGEGSCFWLEIPVEVVALDDFSAQVTPADRIIGLASGQPVWRILVAEDDPASQKLIQRLLGQLGIEVRVADNGEEAVHLFREWHPQLILMDIRMPILDGIQATRLIRSLPGGKGVSIIALTASVFEEDQETILAAGCDDVIFKPVQLERLLMRIAERIPILYRYEEKFVVSQSPEAIMENARCEAEQLPEMLRQQLAAAAARLDAEAIEIMLLDIEVSAPAFAQQIRQCLQKFDFGQIVNQLVISGQAKGEAL